MGRRSTPASGEEARRSLRLSAEAWVRYDVGYSLVAAALLSAGAALLSWHLYRCGALSFPAGIFFAAAGARLGAPGARNPATPARALVRVGPVCRVGRLARRLRPPPDRPKPTRLADATPRRDTPRESGEGPRGSGRASGPRPAKPAAPGRRPIAPRAGRPSRARGSSSRNSPERRTPATLPTTASAGIGASGSAPASPRVTSQPSSRATTRCTMTRPPKTSTATSPTETGSPHAMRRSSPGSIDGRMLRPPNRASISRRVLLQTSATASSRSPDASSRITGYAAARARSGGTR